MSLESLTEASLFNIRGSLIELSLNLKIFNY